MDLIHFAFDSTNNKVVVAYRDGSDSDKGKARVGTVSGTSVLVLVVNLCLSLVNPIILKFIMLLPIKKF